MFFCVPAATRKLKRKWGSLMSVVVFLHLLRWGSCTGQHTKFLNPKVRLRNICSNDGTIIVVSLSPYPAVLSQTSSCPLPLIFSERAQMSCRLQECARAQISRWVRMHVFEMSWNQSYKHTSMHNTFRTIYCLCAQHWQGQNESTRARDCICAHERHVCVCVHLETAY